MTNFLDAARQSPRASSILALDAPFLSGTLLAFLKPRLKHVLMPVSAKLAAAGITANQVTLFSLAGSIAVSLVLCFNPTHPALFALLPLWIPLRTACAAIDGTLAIEFGMKSRLGGILNEAGDIVSDIALPLPFVFIAPSWAPAIALLIALTVLTEIAGIAGPLFGADRRLEGPLGKADRSVLLSILGILIALFGDLPEEALRLAPVIYAGLVLTILNRIRFAIAAGRRAAK